MWARGGVEGGWEGGLGLRGKEVEGKRSLIMYRGKWAGQGIDREGVEENKTIKVR